MRELIMKTPVLKNNDLDQTSIEILRILEEEFSQKNRQTKDLQEGYEGISLKELEAHVVSSEISKVDYDLSLKALEDQKLVETGPIEPFENDPSSSVVFIALISKRNYVYLKEGGYKIARQAKKSPKKNIISKLLD